MKALIIVTTENDPYKQLGWYDFNLFDGQKLDIIFVVNDNYKLINVYDIKQTVNQYTFKIDVDSSNEKMCTVNFYEYVTLNNNLNKVKIPKVNNLTICDFNEQTKVFNIEKRKRKAYTFTECGLNTNDEIYFYQLDSAFKNKYTEGYELIIDDPNKSTVYDPKIGKTDKDNSISNLVKSKFDYNMKRNSNNKLRDINCKYWTITKETYNNIPDDIKNDTKKLSKYIKEHSLYSMFKKGKK